VVKRVPGHGEALKKGTIELDRLPTWPMWKKGPRDLEVRADDSSCSGTLIYIPQEHSCSKKK